MARLADFVKAKHEADSTPVGQIPKVVEIDAWLFEPSTVDEDTGTISSNKYRGRNDAAGTVRVRAYVGGDAQELKGDVLTATLEDVTKAEPVTMGNGTKLSKLEFRDLGEQGALIVLWAPEDADIEGVRITL